MRIMQLWFKGVTRTENEWLISPGDTDTSATGHVIWRKITKREHTRRSSIFLVDCRLGECWAFWMKFWSRTWVSQTMDGQVDICYRLSGLLYLPQLLYLWMKTYLEIDGQLRMKSRELSLNQFDLHSYWKGLCGHRYSHTGKMPCEEAGVNWQTSMLCIWQLWNCAEGREQSLLYSPQKEATPKALILEIWLPESRDDVSFCYFFICGTWLWPLEKISSVHMVFVLRRDGIPLHHYILRLRTNWLNVSSFLLCSLLNGAVS